MISLKNDLSTSAKHDVFFFRGCLLRRKSNGRRTLPAYMGLPAPQYSSGKWRFSLGSPIWNFWIILVVTGILGGGHTQGLYIYIYYIKTYIFNRITIVRFGWLQEKVCPPKSPPLSASPTNYTHLANSELAGVDVVPQIQPQNLHV